MKSQPFYKKWLFWVIAVILIAGLVNGQLRDEDAVGDAKGYPIFIAAKKWNSLPFPKY
ncbi:hypothetical protein SAMN04487969_101362 [Paenibacillus algorifonticola]|uniref:Uncharacterized protein n=1 Tax=Paenibacillus algorifonticola TaxID=684063 RepID=A0A1I1Y7H8_9BACL|nr:hypothetical protein [Paenibacillus algorifonticola]SFE15595.1 hypothetical protein SAMN04487969_101362 [Paenibacillus algorifonticola]